MAGTMEKLLRFMAEKSASDLFLSVGSPVHVKLDGVARPLSEQLLDPAKVESLIREIVTEMGATALTITHDMRSVRAIADKVAMLHEGVIRWHGPAAEIDTNRLPSVVVDDLTNGRKVNFRNLVPQEKPILLWAMNGHPLGCT